MFIYLAVYIPILRVLFRVRTDLLAQYDLYSEKGGKILR